MFCGRFRDLYDMITLLSSEADWPSSAYLIRGINPAAEFQRLKVKGHQHRCHILYIGGHFSSRHEMSVH